MIGHHGVSTIQTSAVWTARPAYLSVHIKFASKALLSAMVSGAVQVKSAYNGTHGPRHLQLLYQNVNVDKE